MSGMIDHQAQRFDTSLLVGGTVWRSQAVIAPNVHGLTTVSLDHGTHQNKVDSPPEPTPIRSNPTAPHCR